MKDNSRELDLSASIAPSTISGELISSGFSLTGVPTFDLTALLASSSDFNSDNNSLYSSS